MRYLIFIMMCGITLATDPTCQYVLTASPAVGASVYSAGTIDTEAGCLDYKTHIGNTNVFVDISQSGYPEGCSYTSVLDRVIWNSDLVLSVNSQYKECTTDAQCVEYNCETTTCKDSAANNYDASGDNQDNTLCRFDYTCMHGVATDGETTDKNNRASCDSCSVNYVLDPTPAPFVNSCAGLAICSCAEDDNNNNIKDSDEIEGCMTVGANNYRADANVATTCTYDYSCNIPGFDANPCGCATAPGQNECLGKDDWYVAGDMTHTPEADLVWVTKDVECGPGNFVTLSAEPGLDKFACMACAVGGNADPPIGERAGFLLEFTSQRERKGNFDHGRCCVNGHHKVCQQLLRSFKENCVDTDKGHVSNRDCA